MSGENGSGTGTSLSALSRGIGLVALGVCVCGAGWLWPGLFSVQARWWPLAALLPMLAGLIWLGVGMVPRLRRGQEAGQLALEQWARLFDTLEQGVFVLDAGCCVGTRVSAGVARLLGEPLSPGEHFRERLARWLPAEEQETANLYLRLLLGGRTREKLMRDLNPLREVAVQTPQGLRYLGFEFRRVREGEALHLLGTISDVTETANLRRALDSARHRADEQWALMLRLVQVQPAALMAFIDETAVGLVDIHDRLKSASGRIGEYRALANHMFRAMHQLKSSATALGLDFVAGEAAAVEDLLDRLRGEDRYRGDDLAAVSGAIQQLFEHLDWLRRVARRHAGQPAEAGAAAQVDFPASMAELARRVAQDLSRQVQPRLRLAALETLPREAAAPLRVIVAQLVRNAIAHGIEGPAEREGAGKPGAGQLLVELQAGESGRHVLRVVDDGRGLCPQRLRTILRDSGRRSEQELAGLSDQQVIMEIFKRGFTTAEEVSQHAGRGVGLDLVSEAVRRIGGRVRLRSEPGRYTEFRVEFAA